MSKRHLQSTVRNTVSLAPKVPDPRRTSFSDDADNSTPQQNVSVLPFTASERPPTSWLNLYVRFADAVTLLASFAAIALAVFAICRAWPLIAFDAGPQTINAVNASPKPETPLPSSKPERVPQ